MQDLTLNVSHLRIKCNHQSFKAQLNPETGEAGSINPAAQQLDFYIRSPEKNHKNHPNREVFGHFFAMEVTW